MTDAFRERGFVRSEGLGKLCGQVSLLCERSERQAGQQMRRKKMAQRLLLLAVCGSRLPSTPHSQDYAPCSASGNTEVGNLL